MAPYYKDLTADEKRRNTSGPLTIYQYTSENLGVREAPEYFPPVSSSHAQEEKVWLKDVNVSKDKLIQGILPGAKESSWYGFPSLKHLKFWAKLEHGKVYVFQQNSRGLNMMLHLEGVKSTKTDDYLDIEPDNVDSPALEEVARKYLGKEIHVGWPHLVKALPTCITNMKYKYTIKDDGEIVGSELASDELLHWTMYGKELSKKNQHTLGLVIGKVEIIVFAKQLIGHKYEYKENGIAEKKYDWSPHVTPYAMQTIVDNLKVLPCEKLCGGDPHQKLLTEVFPKGQVAFSLEPSHYGDEVKVLDSSNSKNIEVELQSKNEPNIEDIKLLKKTIYFQGAQAAAMCGLSPHVFSRITGRVLVQTSENESNPKVNIGLNMKFNKTNQEMIGYTKRVNDRFWNYSTKAVDVVKEYKDKFPDLFNKLTMNCSDGIKKENLFEENHDIQLQEITMWIATHPYIKTEVRNCNSELLGENEIEALEKIISHNSWKTSSTITMKIKPEYLVLPICQVTLSEPDSSAQHKLYDRVVNIRECHPIPLGMKGHIIGIEAKEDERGTLYDILFDEPIIGGFQLYTEEKRCYSLTRHAFINLSHGCRKISNETLNEGKQKARAIIPNNIADWRSGFKELKIDAEGISTKALKTPVKMEHNLRPDYSAGNNTVTKFFSAYLSPNVAQGPLLHGNQTLPHSPNRQPQPSFQPHAQPNANSEFQAMWNHLQNQKVPSDNVPLSQAAPTTPSKFSSAANEQTNALRKILKLRDNVQPQHPLTSTNNNTSSPSLQLQPQQQHHLPLRADAHNILGRSPSNTHKSCSHSASCCAALINYCQRTGCTYPVYYYETNNATKEISALIRFPDGMQIKGLPAKDKHIAAETAACLTLKSLTEGKQLMQGRPIPKFHQPAIARITNHMTSLPSPPHQWCLQNKRENWRLQMDSTFQDNLQLRPSPSFTGNNFVPLQAQVPRVQSQQQQLQPSNKSGNNMEVLKPTVHQQLQSMNSKGKINGSPSVETSTVPTVTDKSFSIGSSSQKIATLEKTNTDIQRPGNYQDITGTPSVRDKDTMTPTGSGTVKFNQQSRPRTKSRLAARFNTPAKQ